MAQCELNRPAIFGSLERFLKNFCKFFDGSIKQDLSGTLGWSDCNQRLKKP